MGRTGKSRRSYSPGIVEIWERELGHLTPRSFTHRFGASEDLVRRLSIHKKLEKHRGCVNTVSFNADGNILVSGSDDRMVMLWNWDMGITKLAFHSGHTNNVFQAKFMPYSDDRTIVTCAADGEVRYAQILEGGKVETKMLAQHEGCAHKLAIETGSPYIFYSCGEDGLVQHFDLRTQSATPLFTCKALQDRSSFIPVIHLNAIAIDPRSPNLFAVAGSDEYTRLYDIRKYKWDASGDQDYPIDFFCPSHLIGDDQVGITGLAFSEHSELIVSYNDELIYLFTKNQGLGPDPAPVSPRSSMDDDAEKQPCPDSASPSTERSDPTPRPQAFKGHRNCDTVKGVSFFGSNCEFVVSGSDCGRIFIWRKKDGVLLRVMEGDTEVVNCIEPHPHAPIFASSGIDDDIKMWIPNASEPSPPVNMEELKRGRRRRRSRLCRLPGDVISQLLALQRQMSRSGNGEEIVASGELVDLIMGHTYGDGSDDESGESSGNPRDCIVQ